MHRRTKADKRLNSKRLRNAIKNSSVYQMSLGIARRYLWGAGISKRVLRERDTNED